MKRVWAETHDQRQATLRQPYASPEVRQRVSEGTRRGQAAAEPRDYASDEYRQKLSDSITAWNAKRRAEGKHRLKLTEELVQQIWQAYQEMEPKNMNKIAVQFGVSPTHTRRIIHQMEAS
jgi:AraC-like DNA-binding protein